MTDQMTLDEKLERFSVLRDTIEGLRAEKDALGEEIKEAMLKGAKPECDLYRADLRATRTALYPVDRFRETYGDAATFEVSKVDNKRVKELVSAGDLDGEKLKDIVTYQVRHALYLVAKTQEEAV
ncbi:hypothetical protein [Deinococcus fonticola]|uniref:hypothetical protein n=1 Tax=Deinococcus fonticola TaxID=2528713 RepID=UPI0010757199|nr:hypothetical protein [Deinococcus fonticola]